MKILAPFNVLALLLAALSGAQAAPKTSGLSEIACECSCTVGTKNGVLVETKKLSPPNGDAKACGQFNNVSCRNATADGSTRLGKLSGCEAVVTMTKNPRLQAPGSKLHKIEQSP
jgi:hypothetical protein